MYMTCEYFTYLSDIYSFIIYIYVYILYDILEMSFAK